MDNPSVVHSVSRPFTVTKARVDELIDSSPELVNLIFAFIGLSAFWLIFGTFVGEFMGMQFVWPETNSAPWLTFGRVRPVHTNVVFWGFLSEAMIGLAIYVVPRTSQRELFSYKLGWVSFGLINISVLAGVICLLNGITNGGQEYREFIWPALMPEKIY